MTITNTFKEKQFSKGRENMDSAAAAYDNVTGHPPKKIIPLKRSNSFDSDDGGQLNDGESTQEEENATSQLNEQGSKHNLILSRFRQTLSLQNKLQELGSTTTQEGEVDNHTEKNTDEETAHPLTNIPQPAKVSDSEFLHHYTHKELSDSTAWLNTTKIIYDSSMVRPFADYKDLLSPRLLENVQKGFSNSTFPIQTSILNTLLPALIHTYRLTKHNFTRRIGDMLVNAATGSGKTLAYALPIVQILSDRTVNKLRCLIIVPTRPLIHQVFETFDKLTRGTSLIVMTSKYEVSLAEEHRRLQAVEPDIFITAPGRLVDHLQLNSFSLRNLKFLVLDEADRLLNQSFQNWCSILINRLDSDKQRKGKIRTAGGNSKGDVIKMVFSATLTTNTQKLHELQLFNPKLFLTDSVKLYSLPSGLQEINVNIPTAKSLYKPLFLLHLAQLLPENFFMGTSGYNGNRNNNKLLVFVKSNEASIRLAALLSAFLNELMQTQAWKGNDNISIESINSNNSKATNRKILSNFVSSGDKSLRSILITTDLMSRGIDIPNVTSVINYDPPVSSQQYVHRCGRTARANATGLAFNMLVGKGEKKYWVQRIDCDISRSVSSNSFGNVAESDGEAMGVKTLEGDELATVINVSNEEEDIYKKCLGELRNGTSADSH